MSVANALGYNNFTTPIGSIYAFAGSQIPLGYLQCDGSSFSQSMYPLLYEIIGTGYGTDASGNPRTPNLVNNFIKGSLSTVPSLTPNPATSLTGFYTATLTEENIPPFDLTTTTQPTFSIALNGTAMSTSLTQKRATGPNENDAYNVNGALANGCILTVDSLAVLFSNDTQSSLPIDLTPTDGSQITLDNIAIVYIIKALY